MTHVVSKQLLPVYNKPMIYYPLSTLMLAGLREILVISTPQDTPICELLGDGSLGHGDQLCGAAQSGRAGAGVSHRQGFYRRADRALILGDNIFYGQGFSKQLQAAAQRLKARRCLPIRWKIRSATAWWSSTARAAR